MRQFAQIPGRKVQGRRTILILTLLLFLPTFVYPQNNNPTKAQADLVCRNWLAEVSRSQGQWAGESNPQVGDSLDIVSGDVLVAYVYNIQPEGVVIIPNSMDLPPIYSYSEEGRYSTSSGVTIFATALIATRLQALDEKEGVEQTRHRQQWDRYLKPQSEFLENLNRMEFKSIQEAGPLLTTYWHQRDPFNADCPEGQVPLPSPVGCVATAASQIMNFHKWPPYGRGSHSYDWDGDDTVTSPDYPPTPGGIVAAGFSDSYDWELMNNVATDNDVAGSAVEDAIAELCFEVGVSCEMDYGWVESGAFIDSPIFPDMNNAFVEYFRYEDATDVVSRISQPIPSGWFSIIQEEINAERPILLSIITDIDWLIFAGGSHAVVIDGWRYDPLYGDMQYHINYGWGDYEGGDDDGNQGVNTGWFYIDEIPNVESTFYEFMLRNIQPDFSSLPPLQAPNLSNPDNGDQMPATSVYFDWDSVSGASGYELFLGTSCTGSGSEHRTDYSEYVLHNLVPGETYYWRVRSISGRNVLGPYSACRSFTVQSIPEPHTNISISSLTADPLTVDGFGSVLVSGTALYEDGSPVSVGTATISVESGSNYSAPISNGFFSRYCQAPGNESSTPIERDICVSATDGVVTPGTDCIQIYVRGQAQPSYDLITNIVYDYEGDDNSVSWWTKDSFRTTDEYVDLLSVFKNMSGSGPLDLKRECFYPNGEQYGQSLIAEDQIWLEWGWGWHSWGWYIADHSMAYHPGKYQMLFYVNNQLMRTHEYVVAWDFVGHYLCKQITEDYLPVDVANQYSPSEERVIALNHFEYRAQELNYRTEFWNPEGDLYQVREGQYEDDLGPHEWYGWSRDVTSLWIAGTAAQNMCGEWEVVYKVQNPSSGVWEEQYSDGFNLSESVPPTAAVITNPDPLIGGQAGSLQVAASDNNHLDHIILHWNDGSDHQQDWVSINSGSFSAEQNLGTLTSGQSIVFWVEAIDESGNRFATSQNHVVVQQESVSIPDTPTGPEVTTADPNVENNYLTTGSTCSLGHSVEYQFNWGDGRFSDWCDGEAAVEFASPGFYPVSARARCAINHEIESSWSVPLTVTVEAALPAPEEISFEPSIVAVGGSTVLTWSEVEGADSYILFKNGEELASFEINIVNFGSVQLTFSGSYTVKACNEAGCSPPSPPADLLVTPNGQLLAIEPEALTYSRPAGQTYETTLTITNYGDTDQDIWADTGYNEMFSVDCMDGCSVPAGGSITIGFNAASPYEPCYPPVGTVTELPIVFHDMSQALFTLMVTETITLNSPPCDLQITLDAGDTVPGDTLSCDQSTWIEIESGCGAYPYDCSYNLIYSYSVDGGETWTEIYEGHNFWVEWTPPADYSTEVYVRLQGTDWYGVPVDYQTGPFTIDCLPPLPPCSLSLVGSPETVGLSWLYEAVLTNEGTEPVSGDYVLLEVEPDFTPTQLTILDPAPFTLAPGASDTIQVEHPLQGCSTDFVGRLVAHLGTSYSGPDSELAAIHISGQEFDQNLYLVQPDTLRFNDCVFGQSYSLDFQAENRGCVVDPPVLDPAVEGSGEFTVHPMELEVGGGQTENITVTFTPVDAGPDTARITFAGSHGLVSISEVVCIASTEVAAGFVVTPEELYIPEGIAVSLGVTLAGPPLSPVTADLDLATDDPDLLLNNTGSLIFDQTNWDQTQLINIESLEDDDYCVGSAILTVSDAAGEVPDVQVPIHEVENDNMGLDVITLAGPEGCFAPEITLPPGEPTALHIILLDPSETGVYGFEASLVVDPEITITGISYPEEAINIGTGTDFFVSYTYGLVTESTTVLATLEVVVTDDQPHSISMAPYPEGNLGYQAFYNWVPFSLSVPVVINGPMPVEGWVDIATGTALEGTSSTTGVSWADFDNDDDPDVYIVNKGLANQLLRNDGGGIFTPITGSPAGNTGPGMAATLGDYDNDGLADIYLVNETTANVLLRNTGNLGFSDVTTAPLDHVGKDQSAAWVDYDLDGYLDLYISNEIGQNLLLQGSGTSSFSSVLPPPAASNMSEGMAWGDFDNDGDQDLYLCLGDVGNQLLRNDGGGVFTDVTTDTLAVEGPSQGAAWGDYNNDGRLDLFVTNWGPGNRLLRNEGDGVFADKTTEAMDASYDAQAAIWGDFDNDADLDLYIAYFGYANKLLRNDGGDVFTDVTAEYPDLGDTGNTVAASWVDVDSDGKLDLYASNIGAPNRLFRNQVSNDNHWLQIELQGTRSNHAALGARVEIVIDGESQYREVMGRTGYLSQSAAVVRFGLGTAEYVDEVKVTWPKSLSPHGYVYTSTLAGVGPVDRRIVIAEPMDPVPVEDEDAIPAPTAFALNRAYPNPFNPMTRLSYDLPEEVPVRLHIYDLAGKLVRTLVAGEVQPAGRHEIIWQGKNDRGQAVSTGVYIYRIKAGTFTQARRMTLVK